MITLSSGPRSWGLSWLALLVCVSGAEGQATVTRRARPPQWDSLPPGPFFKDAFAEGLRGERPKSLGGANSVGATRADVSVGAHDAKPTPLKWSDQISAETLEDEVKSIQRRIAAATENAGDFIAQGHRELRPDLGTAAVVFAVIQQFDGPIRWQRDAATARDRFARAAQYTRSGSVQVHRQVADLAQDVGEMIRGSRLAGKSGETDVNWPDIADRQLIMRRLEFGADKILAPTIGAASSITQNASTIVRESELVVLLARVLQETEMADARDDEYRLLCQQLERAAIELRQAARDNDPPAARQALGRLKQHCTSCHDLYRG